MHNQPLLPKVRRVSATVYYDLGGRQLHSRWSIEAICCFHKPFFISLIFCICFISFRVIHIPLSYEMHHCRLRPLLHVAGEGDAIGGSRCDVAFQEFQRHDPLHTSVEPEQRIPGVPSLPAFAQCTPPHSSWVAGSAGGAGHTETNGTRSPPPRAHGHEGDRQINCNPLSALAEGGPKCFGNPVEGAAEGTGLIASFFSLRGDGSSISAGSRDRRTQPSRALGTEKSLIRGISLEGKVTQGQVRWALTWRAERS